MQWLLKYNKLQNKFNDLMKRVKGKFSKTKSDSSDRSSLDPEEEKA